MWWSQPDAVDAAQDLGVSGPISPEVETLGQPDPEGRLVRGERRTPLGSEDHRQTRELAVEPPCDPFEPLLQTNLGPFALRPTQLAGPAELQGGEHPQQAEEHDAEEPGAGGQTSEPGFGVEHAPSIWRKILDLPWWSHPLSSHRLRAMEE